MLPVRQVVGAAARAAAARSVAKARGGANARGFATERPTLPFRLGRLNHVAVAVPNLEKATVFYRDTLGGNVSAPQVLPEHGVTVVFVNLGNTKLELLEPLGEASPIAGFLKKNSLGGMHHVCYEVDNVTEAIRSLKENGIRVLNDEPKIGAHGLPVVFVHPKDCGGVLTELEEVKA